MRGNVFVRYSLFLFVGLPIGFLLLYPQLLRCTRVRSSADFRLLSGTNNVYISRVTTTRQQTRLQQHRRTANDRIQKFWGNREGKAIVIYCPEQDDYEQYCAGGEGAGCSVGTPWGTSYLILGPEGNNTDVIAHELCHDELFARLGWWRVKRQIPQWFNEGLALMVDYRFSSPTVWEQPDTLDQSQPEAKTIVPFPQRPMLKLSELESTRDFFGGDYMHTMLAYQTAADELTRWLSIVGHKGVATLTDEVEAGKDFQTVYLQLERAKRRSKR
ncbi:hypothetical protein [Spirosoma aerophilum]